MNLQRDAARLVTISTVFVWVGWLAVLYSFIAGLLWWIDLAGRPNFNFLEAFAISAAAIGGPLFLALIVAGRLLGPAGDVEREQPERVTEPGAGVVR